MRNDDAVNGTVGRNGNIIDDPVNRVAQKFDTGDESDIELTLRKAFAKHRWMIEMHLTRPPTNEWAGVEIFDAADAERFQISWRARWLRPAG